MPKPVLDPKREIRIGLVLYGGVSLAVYMYGVVREFWRLVRASEGIEINAYTDILKEIQAVATVDVISGTSAGGINGVFLAKALATGADLAVLRSMWLDRGDFAALMRGSDDLAPRSLLRSDYFEDQLLGALNEMDRRSTKQPLVEVLDLFVSATRLRGRTRSYLDDLGQTVQTRDYRQMFHLRFRQKGYNPADRSLGRDRNDFEPSANLMLMEICRATSAFPGAFEPRLIAQGGANVPLFGPGDPPAAYYSDGGILHNKPFTETLRTIFTRGADRPIRRWLLSVEPDPEYYAAEAAPGPEPEVLEVLLKALSGIPLYQSIARDLDELGAHNAKVRQVEVLLGRIEGMIREKFQGVVNEGTQEEFRRFLEQQVLYYAYESLKLEAATNDLTDRIVGTAGLREDSRPFVLNGVNELRRQWGTSDFLDNFDDAFRLRRAYYLIETLGRFSDALPDEDRDAFRPSHQRLWAHFEQIRALRREVFQEGDSGRRLRGLHDQGGDALTQAVVDVLKAIAPSLATGLANVRLPMEATCRDIEALTAGLRGKNLRGVTFPPHPFPAIFERYEIRDMFILPLEVLADLGERDPIRFIRISPSAASYVQKQPDQKLAGDTLGHFGGFLHRDWRANDILWGRLDAAEVVSRMLLEGQAREKGEQSIHRLQEEITREELPLVWQAHPNLNYKAYLEEQHRIGEQELGDLPAEVRLPLALRATQVVRNMARRLEQSSLPRGLRSGFRYTGLLLGSALSLIRWPSLALWGRDLALKRLATFVLLFLFGWGLLGFVAGLLGLIPLTSRLVLWGIFLVAPFIVWTLFLERWIFGVIVLALFGLGLVWRFLR